MSIPDPWGTPPEEPQQQAPVAAQQPPPAQEAPPAQTPWDAPPPQAAPAPPAPVVVPTSDGKITLTFKGAGNYGDRWLVAHVANPAEGLALLMDPQFKELLELSKKVANFDGAGSAPAEGAAPRQPQQGQPAASLQPPSWAPEKPEADFVYKTGVAKSSGKTWHAWMPPTKEDPREPKFFYPPR